MISYPYPKYPYRRGRPHRLERELRVGGKAAAFEYAGQKFPLGAVGTPLALPEASFTESQV